MEFIKKEPIIILIGGKARSGKSTIAHYIEEAFKERGKSVVISPYTKYLKLYIDEITETKMTDTDKPRDLLQKISSELIKKKLGKNDFFIDRQIEDIEFYTYFKDIIIIPDVRFPREFEVIKEKFKNVISILVARYDYLSDLTEEQQQDITETSLDDYENYDYKISNTVNTNLKEESLKIVKDIEDNIVK